MVRAFQRCRSAPLDVHQAPVVLIEIRPQIPCGSVLQIIVVSTHDKRAPIRPERRTRHLNVTVTRPHRQMRPALFLNNNRRRRTVPEPGQSPLDLSEPVTTGIRRRLRETIALSVITGLRHTILIVIDQSTIIPVWQTRHTRRSTKRRTTTANTRDLMKFIALETQRSKNPCHAQILVNVPTVIGHKITDGVPHLEMETDDNRSVLAPRSQNIEIRLPVPEQIMRHRNNRKHSLDNILAPRRGRITSLIRPSVAALDTTLIAMCHCLIPLCRAPSPASRWHKCDTTGRGRQAQEM